MKFLKWSLGAVTDNATLTFTNPYSGWAVVFLQAQDTTGKHYFEVQHLSGNSMKSGIHNVNSSNFWYLDDFRGGSFASPACTKITIPAYANLARTMVAYDLDAGKIWFGVNGTWFGSGDPASGANPSMSDITAFGVGNPIFPIFELYQSSARCYPDAADWLYAPAGFTEATEFDLGVRASSIPLRRDIEDGGPLSIIEPVTRLNAVPPQSRRVRLCDQRSGRLVREQWSDPTTGEVDFPYLREGPWVLYALDHTYEHEAVIISDRLATVDGLRP